MFIKGRDVLILLFAVVLQGCLSNKYLKSESYITGNSDLVFFTPLTNVYSVKDSSVKLIGSKMKEEYNDSLSKLLNDKVCAYINVNRFKYKIKKQLIVEDEIVNSKVRYELGNLIYQSKGFTAKKNIEFPHTIDSILESRNQRYAICISGIGFSYKKESALKKTATNSLSVLSLGIVSPPSIKNGLSFSSVIIDSKENQILYVRNTISEDRSPLELDVIQRQLDQLFEDNTYK